MRDICSVMSLMRFSCSSRNDSAMISLLATCSANPVPRITAGGQVRVVADLAVASLGREQGDLSCYRVSAGLKGLHYD